MKPPLDRAIAAAREATGTRWCIGCAKHRQTDGGRVRVGGNGARIWRCAHCRHSEYRLDCLWCLLHDRRADTSCGDYEREPGSDDA